MRKIISLMHVSLDGFVASPNGELDWVKLDDELFGHVEKRVSKTDSAMYGRKTFELMESYWPTAADRPNASRHDIEHSRWYQKAHKIVLSATMKGTHPNTTVISDHLTERINELKQKPGDEILVFGSPTATHSLVQLNLLDGFWLFLNPVVLGKGTPLFGNRGEKLDLKLLPETRRFANGVITLNYDVVKD